MDLDFTLTSVLFTAGLINVNTKVTFDVVILSHPTRTQLDQGSVERRVHQSPLLTVLKGLQWFRFSQGAISESFRTLVSVWIIFFSCECILLRLLTLLISGATQRVQNPGCGGRLPESEVLIFETWGLWVYSYFLNGFYFPRNDALKALVNKLKIYHGEFSESCIY